MKKMDTLADALPIVKEETGVLIRWNRITGDVKAYIEGQPIHIDSLMSLFQGVMSMMDVLTNKAGIIVPSLPVEERNQYFHEMPINQIEEDNDDSEGDIPPWLKEGN